MDKTIDPYRFISNITRRMLRTRVEIEKPRPVPWPPLRKSLRECKAALLSSAGCSGMKQQPDKSGTTLKDFSRR